MGFTTLKWPGQEASYFAALHSGRGSTKTSSRVLYFGEKEMLVQKRKLNMMRGLTFTFKAVPGQ